MRPRRTAPLRTAPPRPTPVPPAHEGGAEGADEREGVVGEIGGGGVDGGAHQGLVARLRRAGERGERAPAALRARVAAILAVQGGEP